MMLTAPGTSFRQTMTRERSEGFRWLSPYIEAPRRKLNITLLGIVLLATFIAPVIVPAPDGGFSAMFNLGILFLDNVPWIAAFLTVYPGVAAILVMGLAVLVLPPARGIGLLIVGGTFVAVPLIWAGNEVIAGMLDDQGLAAAGAATLQVTGLVGMFGLLVGSRARWYRPGARSAYAIGLLGGGLYVLGLIAPAGPGDIQTMPVMLAVGMLAGKGTLVAGLMICFHIVCTLAASALSFVNTPGTPHEKAHGLAGLAFRLLVVGVVLGVAAPVVGAVAALPTGAGAAVVALVIYNAAKVAGSIIGILLLMPVGLADAIVGTPWRRHAPPRKAPTGLGHLPPIGAPADPLTGRPAPQTGREPVL